MNNYPFEKIQWVGEIPTHFIGRCPFCGDSQRHPSKGHLYVSKKYPVYICHRCNKSGHIKDIEEDESNEETEMDKNDDLMAAQEQDLQALSSELLEKVKDQAFVEGIQRLNPQHIILCRVDDQMAIDIGQALGITLFQGYFVQKMLYQTPKAQRLNQLK